MSDTIEVLKARRDHLRRELARSARSLSDHLSRTAMALDRGGEVVSDLGEIQSTGTIFDVKCGRYVELCRAIELLEHAK